MQQEGEQAGDALKKFPDDRSVGRIGFRCLVDGANSPVSIGEGGVQDSWQVRRASALGRLLVICPFFMHIAGCNPQAADYGLRANGTLAGWLANYLNMNGLLKPIRALP